MIKDIKILYDTLFYVIFSKQTGRKILSGTNYDKLKLSFITNLLDKDEIGTLEAFSKLEKDRETIVWSLNFMKDLFKLYLKN